MINKKDSLINITEAEKKSFFRDGYHVIPSLLSCDKAKRFRYEINKLFNFPEEDIKSEDISYRTYALADGVTKKSEFWPIIFNEKLLSTIRGLIGHNIRYVQHSDLHINLGGGRYHRDSCCRKFGTEPDWDESVEPYKIVRVAIYLSDYKDSGSSLELLPSSHKRESWLNQIEYTIWNKIRVKFRKLGLNEFLPHWFLSRKKITIKTKPGDCIIFDQRLMHAGGDLGKKDYPKYAIYLAFGIDNSHTRNHRNFYQDRPTYEKNISNDLKVMLKEKNLLLE
tara:strand:- start:3559 stop:4398 length:840 start_codon:yes stop_codon:yes gene_type:complete